MKKLSYFFILLLISGFISQTAFPQEAGDNSGTKLLQYNGNNLNSPILINNGNQSPDWMYVWALPSNGATSGNPRIPGNLWKYQRCEYLILASEITASGFPSGVDINSIVYNIVAAGTGGAMTGTLNVYLKNTTDLTYTLGSTWTTTGFTMVSTNAAWTVPIAVGNYEISFVGGSPFTYTGGGVYVAWEFSSPAGVIGTTARTADCNNTVAGLLYSGTGTTALPTTLATSAFRPATKFGNSFYTDIIQVTNIYTLGKVPTPFGTPTPIGVRVSNVDVSAQTLNVTIEVRDVPTSTLRYTATQTVTALAGGASTVLNFTGWTPTIQENVNITATTSVIPGENWILNNTLTTQSNVNGNTYSLNYSNASPGSGYGFTFGTGVGLFAVKYTANGSVQVMGANLVLYNYAANVGDTTYAVLLNSAGTILQQTAPYIIQAGDLGTTKNFTFPSPTVISNDVFYVALAQTYGVAQWYPMAIFVENPGRGNINYTFPITGGTPSPDNVSWKYGIEAVVQAPSVVDDAGTLTVDVPFQQIPGTYAPQATVQNYGTNSITFNVKMTITGGYSSTKTVTSLAPGTSTQVTFDPWSPAVGTYSVAATTKLTGDTNPGNDTQTKTVYIWPANPGLFASAANYPVNNYLGSGVGYTETVAKTTTGYLFSVGGITSGTGTECYKYNANTNTWTAIASLPVARDRHATAISGHYLYQIGGADVSSVYQSTVYRYDINNDAGGWNAVASLPAANGWGKAVTYNNNIYLAGGYDGANYVSAVYVYDVVGNTWSTATSMPGAKFGGAFSIAGNKLVYVGGASASSILDSVSVGTIDLGNPLLITWVAGLNYPGLKDMKSIPYTFINPADKVPENYINSKSKDLQLDANYPGGMMYRFDGAPWGSDQIIVTGGSPSSTWAPSNPTPCYTFNPTTDTWTQEPYLSSPITAAALGTCETGTTRKLIVASGYGLSGVGNITQVLTFTLPPSALSLNFKAIIQGFYNGTTMTPDTVHVELRNSTAPYALVETKSVLLNSAGVGNPSFTTAVNGTPYYIVVKHRNSIETWSATTETFSGSALSYDFTTAAGQAYGSNQILVGTKWCIFSGDANQDGSVDALDMIAIDNDVANFVTGYVVTDVNGDGSVDALDMIICDNNSANFVAAVKPPGAMTVKIPKTYEQMQAIEKYMKKMIEQKQINDKIQKDTSTKPVKK